MGTLDYQELQRELEERAKGLRKRLSAIHRDRTRVQGALSPDWEEQAQELENEEVLTDLDEHGHQELKLINAALARLDAGTYGVCTECEEPISAMRLKALPFAALCIECARKQEQAQAQAH